MDWLKAESIDDLKKYKTLNNLRSEIKNDLATLFKGKKAKDKNIIEMITINSGSWQGVLDKIRAFREVILDLGNDCGLNNRNKSSEITIEQNNHGYFNSLEDEYIFYLLELDGKLRADKLNITKRCYSNKRVAKSWRDKIAKVIHPDKCRNPKAGEAVIKLNELYKEMTGYE